MSDARDGGRHLDEATWTRLRAEAAAVRERAYAPYSNFLVGAAGLSDDGRLVVGCNVENASVGLTLCAECAVVSSLHATGGGRLAAIACVGATRGEQGRPVMPCGRCRQLIAEQGVAQTLVDTPAGPMRIGELLPHAFDATELTH